MPSPDDHSSEIADAGGGSAHEPLIDRQLERDLLRQHIARVVDTGKGHAILIVGESGVGKSRLATEAAAEARKRGMAVISVRCLGRGAEPLLPLKEALASYLGRTPDQIRRTLTRAAPHLLDAVPFIGTFLASIGEKLAEGSFSLRGVYEELSRVLIRATSGSAGLFLLVDDLHAADPDTLYFLNYLFRKLRQVPLLAVVTIQEEQLGDYSELADLMAEWAATGHVIVTVVPLERAHVGEYVRTMSAMGDQADESIVDRLFHLTGGNPFFLREALNLITQSPGSRLADDVVLPHADAILRRRLARADEATRHFLRAAAVVLDTSDELAPITYVMEGQTKDAIAALTKACEIRLMREGPHGEVSFVHALMQREVHAEMGANQRRYLHARAGEWFERNGALASAAFHFEHAAEFDQMVKAGYQAAAQAERAGMYHTALMLYQKLRPHVSIDELGPRLASVLIVLGDWDEAGKLTGLLPVEDSRVRLLRSELAFVRGDFDCAQAEAEMALMSSGAERVHVLIRLADIALYLGDFSQAQRYGRSALELASTSDAGLRARCEGIVAATEYFGGEIEAAQTRFRDALDLLEGLPDTDRDRVTHATILANLGSVAETTHDWAAAERHHREALRLRREIADARGVLQSLHALGRARLGAGDRDDAGRCFIEAEQLAGSLGETLERAKIWHTRAELLLHDGDASRAQQLAASALETFTRSRTRYDITHARVTLSRAALAAGNGRLAIQQGALARSAVQVIGYGLLCVLYPGDVFDLAARIGGALTAYACGDALGVPWESPSHPNTGLTAEQIEQLPARDGWPRGATSDDTALTLLVARYLADRDGDGDPAAFLAELADQEPAIQGLGPTTTAAIERFRRGDQPAAAAGRATNGAAMRALPIGWALPHDQAERRRHVTIAMSRATHTDLAALVAACVIAACASWALEGARPAMLLEAATEEAREAAQAVGTEPRLAELLSQVSGGIWNLPANGISLDPYDTVAAALWCATRATSLRDGLVSAVQLGGDTDTVAALVGGLIGAKLTADQVRAELPWHQLVILPEPENATADTAAALATTRAIQSV
ncbi:MAG TPA: ADP-ribosylglycohydrolase family protein [Streptosporangiaceae bacterium]|nr:ADP-ribosylglycohydrolase family protein [Streptosporangiaceae bacterium]